MGYEQHFNGAPFAHKGGLPGTTARLRRWLSTLAKCINSGICPPSVVGLTLGFLNTPEPPSVTGNAKQAATAVADRFRGAVGKVKETIQQRAENTQTQAAETLSATAMSFAKQNPKVAQAASGAAMGYAKQNPDAAKTAAHLGGKATFDLMRQNPKAAMNLVKISA